MRRARRENMMKGALKRSVTSQSMRGRNVVCFEMPFREMPFRELPFCAEHVSENNDANL